MPKSKRNKTVDLSKTKKHGLEGKKELYKKIQSNVENYAHVFVFAVNDMRNSKMKNLREQWKHSRFCIGKNKVMAMALGRTPEEEYRPNLHQIGRMLIGERGLLFTNQSIDEVTNWFQSYLEGDYARSGTIATEDVTLSEGPLAQFPHNLESYLRQLGLPTTLKKGVIHLIKEHVVCKQGDRLSPETARILKLLGYEMAEFRIKVLSVWSQDGAFINLQPDSCDLEFKENAIFSQQSILQEDLELVKNTVLLGDQDEMDMAVSNSSDKNKISNNFEKVVELKNVEKDLEEKVEESELVKQRTPKEKKFLQEAKDNFRRSKSLEDQISSDLDENPEWTKLKSKTIKSKSEEKLKLTNPAKLSEGNTNSEESIYNKPDNDVNMEVEEIHEPVEQKPKNGSTVRKYGKNTKKTVAKKSEDNTCKEVLDEKVISKEEMLDTVAIIKLTEKKLEESTEKPKKFSPKMTRARAAAANKKIKTPEPIEIKRTRKRKM